MGKMMLRHFDVSRVHLLEPGITIDAGDRTLVPLQPAYYDAPETVGFFDTHSRVLFSADAFGTLLKEPQDEAAAITPQALHDGMIAWTAIDAPWLGMVDRTAFGRALASIERLDPAAIISGHLPVARRWGAHWRRHGRQLGRVPRTEEITWRGAVHRVALGAASARCGRVFSR